MGEPRGQSGILDPNAELRAEVRGGGRASYQENTDGEAWKNLLFNQNLLS
jgi:hypothetical protein